MIKLYHGSNIQIGKIDLSVSKPYKDFGKGFYLTEDKHQALRMAENRTNITRVGTPTLNVYEFDETTLANSSLRIKVWQDYCEEWAAFVVRNRDNRQPILPVEYDIIYGPIANDGVNFQLRRYTAGLITLKELVQELKYAPGITFQYFFGTEKALATLHEI